MAHYRCYVSFEVPVEVTAETVEEAEISALASVTMWAKFPVGVVVDVPLIEELVEEEDDESL